jgi:DNA helicase-2/ATP-dependent DNA helicase PcrA
MSMSQILEGLNPAQQEAVTWVHGPVLVLAGPGSGKTRVLTHRVAYLVHEYGVEAHRIIGVTFTNKAAREMRGRVERLLCGQLSGLTLGTFHSTCARILRREAASASLSASYVIFDESDQLQAIREAIKGLNLDDKRYRPHAMRAFISRAKCDLLTPQSYTPRTYQEEVAKRIYERYQLLLDRSDALDFGDLLLRTVLLLRDVQEVRERYQERYLFSLVDEFQDTNIAQYELVKLIAGERQNLFVVADEDQSIYRFRGADYRNIERFREDHPQHKMILLEQNYRSTQRILDAANGVISVSRRRTPKRLHTDKGAGPRVTLHEAYDELYEARYVVGEIAGLTGAGEFKLGDCGVMYRTNAQSRALEDAFVKQGMPYKLVGATRFYARRESRDIIASLRLIHNPHDSVSLERVINVPRRGIGGTTIAGLAQWASQMDVSRYEALMLLSGDGDRQTGAPIVVAPFGARARSRLLSFAQMWGRWRELASKASVTELISELVKDTEYESWINDGTEQGVERWANVSELRAVATVYDDLPSETALGMFLEEVALVSDVDDLPETADAPTLLTLHSAKGLEFAVAFIVGMEEGVLPHSRSMEDLEQMEEERRLAYVGMTRAKERLYLVRAFRRTRYGNADLNPPSRFLQDIPAELLTGQRGVTQARAPSTAVPWRPPVSREFERSAHIPEYTVGQQVRHPTFGDGVVIESKRVRDDEEIQVAFPGRGIKKLLASFAKLETLGE